MLKGGMIKINFKISKKINRKKIKKIAKPNLNKKQC